MTQMVTIFGGTGFLGRYVVDLLADRGVTIRLATRRPAAANFLRTFGAVGQIIPVSCNIHDEASVRNVVADSDMVINLIGILAERGSKQNFQALQTEFPARLAKIVAQQNVQRLVHVSALGADKNAASRYARTKQAGEAAIFAAFPNATILRPSIIFGAEDNFFNLFAHMAEISPFLPLIGGGKTLFQPAFVGDVAAAVVASLYQSQAMGKIYELGGVEQLSFKQCLEKIMAYTGHKKPFITIPFALAKLQGAILQRLPGQLLTVDQVASLQSDNILMGTQPGLTDLGITPTPLDTILPSYLKRYRSGGRFAARRHNHQG